MFSNKNIFNLDVFYYDENTGMGLFFISSRSRYCSCSCTYFLFCSAVAVRPSGDKPPSAFDPRFTDGNWDHFPRETSICALIQIFSENEKILHRPGPSCGQHLDYNTWWWWWHNVQKIKKRQVLNCELNKSSPKVK